MDVYTMPVRLSCVLVNEQKRSGRNDGVENQTDEPALRFAAKGILEAGHVVRVESIAPAQHGS